MVYSQICGWLDDYLHGDAPEELLDTWDFMRWVQETEIIALFTEYIMPTFKTRSARGHAIQILMALLWEYYLFRRSAGRVSSDVPDLSGRETTLQRSKEWFAEKAHLLTASEFSGILMQNSRRIALIRSKLTANYFEQPTVFTGRLSAPAWGIRFEPVIKQIYSRVTSNTVHGIGRIRHKTLPKLAASPDGVLRDRLLEIKAPVSRVLKKDDIPYEYYCQMQVQLEVCDIELGDYCECRIVSGDGWADVSGAFIGSVAVVDGEALRYEYSPLYEDTAAGRAAIEAWTPEGQTVVEKKVWQIADMQIIQVRRNRRWWEMVGLPAYQQFRTDFATAGNDPMFFAPAPQDIEEELVLPQFLSEQVFADSSSSE
jgi:hypothetical protein